MEAFKRAQDDFLQAAPDEPTVGWLKITKFLLRHGSSLPGVRNTVVIIMKKRKVKKI